MIDVAIDMMNQTFELVIPLTIIIISLEFVGSFLFNKR